MNFLHFRKLVLILVLACSAPLWAEWFTAQRERADELAGRTPRNSILVASWSLGSHFQPGDGFLEKLPPEARTFYEQAPMFLGTAPHTIAGWFSGRGYFTLARSAEQEPAFTFALELKQQEKFQSWLENLVAGRTDVSSFQHREMTAWTIDRENGPIMLVGRNWMLITSELNEADKQLQSLSGQDQLAESTLFRSAQSAFGAASSNAFFFVDGERIVRLIEKEEGTQAPPSGKAWQYAAMSLDFDSRQSVGLLSFDPDSALARTMARPGRVDQELFRKLPRNMPTMMAGDAAWALRVLQVLARDFPAVQSMVDVLSSNEYGSPEKAFTGRVAFETDLLSDLFPLAEAYTASFSSARSQGQLTACKSNLKNIGTALEMYATDWSGHYPSDMGMLTPNYLRSIPECPSAEADTYSKTMQTGPDAPGNDPGYQDYYHFYCEGDYHPETEPNYPQYNGIVGLDSGEQYEPEEEPVKDDPSTVLVMEVKDVAETHQLLTKLTAKPKISTLTACESNLKNLGTAMEMYSIDWSGKYPENAGLLTPNYLQTMPECPAAQKDTYSESLQTGPDAKGNDAGFQDYYYFECQGHNHRMLEENYPTYDGIRGLTEGPRREVAEVVSEVPMESVPSSPRTYELDGELLLLDPGQKLLILTSGKDAKQLAGASRTEDLPDKLKQDLTGEAIYVTYNDLETLYQSAVAYLEQQSDYGELAAGSLKLLRELTGELRDVQVVQSTSDGLVLRGSGYNSTPAVGSVAMVGAAILVPNFVRARAQGQLTACKSNLKNLGTAMEMYSTDWNGRYPTEMGSLTPDYLRTIPECPAAEAVTYRLETGPEAQGNEWNYEDYYHIECHGNNHGAVGMPENYPQYNGVEGLVAW